MAKITPPVPETSIKQIYDATLLARRWLSNTVFEIELTRPASFIFSPGQRLRFIENDMERDYSLVSIPEDPIIILCIRRVKNGKFSNILATAKIGTRLTFSGPHGYFIFHFSGKRVVFVATGTGIAPFVSMAKSGARDFILLHGVRRPEDIFYEAFFRHTTKRYVPCLSGSSFDAPSPPDAFHGRVTEYLGKKLPIGSYDFYLSGRQEMIRDVISIVDEHFPESLVHTEIFY